jgi:exosortase
VPAFALYLFWTRRPRAGTAGSGSGWPGLPLIAAGAALRILGAYLHLDWVGAASLLPGLAGLAALVGVSTTARRTWPAIAFLAFMIPLPFRVERALGLPLQGMATSASTYALQTLGLDAVAEGHVIVLPRAEIGVAEACNGLGMLYMFLAFATAAALVVRRPAWQKAAIVAGALPIALGANVARITLTGLLHETMGRGPAEALYHDLAGWLMMPLALALLHVEVVILSRLDSGAGPSGSAPRADVARAA